MSVRKTKRLEGHVKGTKSAMDLRAKLNKILTNRFAEMQRLKLAQGGSAKQKSARLIRLEADRELISSARKTGAVGFTRRFDLGLKGNLKLNRIARIKRRNRNASR